MAIPRPMPRPAPVMTATLSVRVFMRPSGDCYPPRLSPRGVALEGAVLASFFFPPARPMGKTGGHPKTPGLTALTLDARAATKGRRSQITKQTRLDLYGSATVAVPEVVVWPDGSSVQICRSTVLRAFAVGLGVMTS